MPHKISMDICSITILGLIQIVYYIKNNMPLRQNKILAATLWLAIASTFCDLLGELWQIRLDVSMRYFPVHIHAFINYVYFITRNLVPLFYLRYVAAVLNIHRKKTAAHMISLYLPILISSIVIAITPFTNAVFYIDTEGRYNRGPMIFVLYAVSVYYLLLIILCTLIYRKTIPFYRAAAFSGFVIISVAGAVAQACFPDFSVETFSISICLLLTHLTIQRPEELIDGITDLFNRNALSIMLSMNLQSKTPFQILLIQLDTLPFWLDSLGMETVNKLLKTVSEFLTRTFKNLSSYKISDSQFCLILNEDAAISSDRAVILIRDRFKKGWNIEDFHINLPARYCTIQCPENADTLENVLGILNMAAAKTGLAGSDIIEVSSLDLTARQRYYKIDRIVKDAVAQNLLEVVYQPIYSVAEQRFASAEALLRLNHKELGKIPPDEFIPIAEKNGSIIKLGRFVRETVCQFIKENNLSELGIDYIEVNMSIIEGFQQDIVDNVLKSLQKYNLPHSCINLELTETAVSSIPEALKTNLEKLHDQGIRFSLDDYGSGYSNLSRILSFPCNIIKLDKSLVQSAFQSEVADTVLSGTFRMLKDINKYVVAEGVETKEQARRLTDMGCDFIQGYYYAKPMSGQEFLQLLKNHENYPVSSEKASVS